LWGLRRGGFSGGGGSPRTEQSDWTRAEAPKGAAAEPCRVRAERIDELLRASARLIPWPARRPRIRRQADPQAPPAASTPGFSSDPTEWPSYADSMTGPFSFVGSRDSCCDCLPQFLCWRAWSRSEDGLLEGSRRPAPGTGEVSHSFPTGGGPRAASPGAPASTLSGSASPEWFPCSIPFSVR